jgi:hypothetical protein
MTQCRVIFAKIDNSFLPKNVFKYFIVPCDCFSCVSYINMSNMLIVYEVAVQFGLGRWVRKQELNSSETRCN